MKGYFYQEAPFGFGRCNITRSFVVEYNPCEPDAREKLDIIIDNIIYETATMKPYTGLKHSSDITEKLNVGNDSINLS